MKTVQASEAKTHFLRLLDEVESGESISITRHGKEVALMSPVQESRTDRARRAFAKIHALRKQIVPMTVAEILAARDEGRP